MSDNAVKCEGRKGKWWPRARASDLQFVSQGPPIAVWIIVMRVLVIKSVLHETRPPTPARLAVQLHIGDLQCRTSASRSTSALPVSSQDTVSVDLQNLHTISCDLQCLIPYQNILKSVKPYFKTVRDYLVSH